MSLPVRTASASTRAAPRQEAREPGRETARAAPAADAPAFRALAMLATAIFLYLGWWAVLRPPFQTPDERQQHLRITSILLHPWFAEPGRFALDARYVSPLAHNQPRPIEKLPFSSDRRVTAPEIVQLEATPWNHAWTLEPFERVYASYPTLYYLSVFAIAQPITAGLSLTPYQSSYLYRFVTAAFAALLWAAVYAALRRIDETRAIAGWIVAIALLNPMLAFLSSGINADAVSLPLSAMAILVVWDNLTRGTGGVRATPVAARGGARQAVGGVAVHGARRRDRRAVGAAALARTA